MPNGTNLWNGGECVDFCGFADFLGSLLGKRILPLPVFFGFVSLGRG